MESRILVVDDEREIVDMVEVLLEGEGFAVVPCHDGETALELIDRETFDLAILDIMMPGADGLALCRAIRKNAAYPVIMLTAKDSEIDKVTGLAMGADDYITKPFLPMELVARGMAQLRRFKSYGGAAPAEAEAGIYRIRGLVLDGPRHRCTVNGQPVDLTPTEFSLLLELCRAEGSVVSADDLYYKIFGEAYYDKSSGSIAVHVRHLREKMGDHGHGRDYIKTVWGCGYRLEC